MFGQVMNNDSDNNANRGIDTSGFEEDLVNAVCHLELLDMMKSL